MGEKKTDFRTSFGIADTTGEDGNILAEGYRVSDKVSDMHNIRHDVGVKKHGTVEKVNELSSERMSKLVAYQTSEGERNFIGYCWRRRTISARGRYVWPVRNS